jgi:hypothetical protein
MANLIIPAAGALVGYAVGGPTGAQLGWVVGSAVATGRQEIRQGTIGDLRVQTAEYGVAIPYVVGRQRVSGNIIWAAEKKTYDIKTKTGKGGPTTVSTGYTVSLLVAICAGPILGVSRVWANGDLIVDARTEAKPLPGQLYLGSLTQTADPTYQSAVGAANAPAYRGLAYMALTDFDLGASGVIPQFSFEVVRGAEL